MTAEEKKKIKRLRSALNIVYKTCRKIIEEAENKKNQNYQLTEESFFKLKGNLQFLKEEFKVGPGEE